MKTNMRQNSSIRFVLKKIGSLFLFLAILVLSEACQYKQPQKVKFSIQDLIRKKHSVELLNVKSSSADVASFDGDANFYRYIAQYIKQNNNKMNADKFTKALLRLSQNQAYDPIFLLAVIKTESAFNYNAIGSAGEIGLMQIKPDTARWICNKLKIKWKGAEALKDPEYNILIGAYYFKYLKRTLKSKSIKYINAYNMGLTNLKRMPSSDLKKYPYFVKVTGNYVAIYSELKKIKVKKLI